MTWNSPYAFEFATRPSATTAKELQHRREAQARRRPDASRMGLDDARLASPHSGLLVVLEALNAGGKDGTIEELQATMSPESLRVERIKRPFPVLREHDLLEVAARLVPAPGEVVFFNRSYYEDPVHAAAHDRPEAGHLCERIVLFEDRLAAEGVRVIKLFLHIDKDEQRRRLDARKRHRHLRHLHNPFDGHDQANWASLMSAYDSVLSQTHTRTSPWSMIPGNDRGFRNQAVQDVLLSALR